ncbi:MAG TPA: AIPR family protein [Nitrososphaeraceae archaeon]|nr:AIPR family protein [Nitrososphaeraceae archaeon]
MIEENLEFPPPRFVNRVRESIHDSVNQGQNSVEKGKLFLEWVLTNVFDATVDDTATQILDGTGDCGIDAISEIQGTDTNYFRIFQAKFGNSHKISEIHKFNKDVTKFLESVPIDIKQDRIRDARIKIRDKGWDCEAIYVTDQEVQFDNTETFKVYGFHQIVEKLWDDVVDSAKDEHDQIKLENFIKYENAIIGIISLTELQKFVSKTKRYVFESNIRKFLKDKTKVNKNLRKTLIKNPEDVFYFNNGITLVVKNFKENSDGKEILLDEPQIVNGAQTSNTIEEIVRADPHIQGYIQITIIKENSVTQRNNITRFRNSQNAVKGRDLISLESFHDSIFAQLKTLGYFYEQQAGAWINLDQPDRNKYKGNDIFNNYLPSKHDKRIIAKDAIQAMIAGIFQEPAKPYGSVSKYLPGGTEYSEIFVENAFPDDYRLLLYPYLVKMYCEKKFGYGKTTVDFQEKKYARLLFVTAYFKLLSNYIVKKESDFRKKPEELDIYFKKFDANSKLLEITNTILEKFFLAIDELRRDDDGKEIITFHNFFANQIWSKEAQRRFVKLANIEKIKLQEIQGLFV